MIAPLPTPVRVSILIAVRNGEGTLGPQLSALLKQTYEGPIEIVVADNGSTDATRALVEQMADTTSTPVVVVDAGARTGAPFARNCAARYASGDVFLICDADDIATRSWVAEMVASLGSHEFVAGALKPFTHTPGDWHADEYRTNIDDWHGYCPTAATANVGVRRTTFERVGGFDERFLAAEDIDLAVRLFEGGVVVEASPGVMWYRQREGAVAWAQNLAWCASWDIAVQAERRERLRAGGRYQSFGFCAGDLARHVLNPHRWPKNARERSHWISQIRIKSGRVRGHLLKHQRLSAPPRLLAG